MGWFSHHTHSLLPGCFNKVDKYIKTSWLHRASNNVETFLLPTDAHNVKKHRVIKTSKITLQHVSVYVETIFRELQSVLG